MVNGYSAAQEDLQARSRDLAGILKDYELSCEMAGGLSPEDLETIRHAVLSHGLQAVNMPAEWGGAGLDVLSQVLVQEELGQVTNALWDTVWRPANVLRYCTPAQRERYLLPAIKGLRRDCYAVSEEGAGSDPAALSASAERTAHGWRIRGEKWFVTVGDVADFLIVLARVRPGDQLTLFLVDKALPGVEIKRVPRYMHTFVFEHPEFLLDVEVGDDAVLGDIGQGYELTKEWFVEERLMIAARCLGAGERALGEATRWAASRVQFGRALIDNQLIQAMLADSAVELAANRALVYQVAAEVDAGVDRKLVHAKAAMAKLSASEAAGRIVDRAVQIFGGRGYMRDQVVERLYRDIRVDRIWEGTSEIQRLVVANHIQKRGLDRLVRPQVTLPTGIPSP